MSQYTHEVLRPDDGELLGFVRQTAPGSSWWQTLAVFGYPLGHPCGYEHAVDSLLRVGLEYLAERWLIYWATDACWYTCQLVEATPEHVVLRNSDCGSADFGMMITLRRPGPEQLRFGREWNQALSDAVTGLGLGPGFGRA